MTKQFNTRIQHKIDTYENWRKAENFFPLEGEIIIYTTDKEGNEKLGLKIGNGDKITNVHNLPFLQSDMEFIQSDWYQEDTTQLDYIKNKPIYSITINQETGLIEQPIEEIINAAMESKIIFCIGALSIVTDIEIDNETENPSWIDLSLFVPPNTVMPIRILADGTPEMKNPDNIQMKSDKVEIISENSTDQEYPTAKAVYDFFQSKQSESSSKIILRKWEEN